jgi:IS30 family transposase
VGAVRSIQPRGRRTIALGIEAKVSNRRIAKALGVRRSTIDRDTGPNGPRREKNSKKTNVDTDAGGPNGPRVVSGDEAAE